jgi:hypothetical protein
VETLAIASPRLGMLSDEPNRYIKEPYTDGPKVRMTFWWKDVDVKKNTRVPREKFGRHSNSIYLVLKPLNKSGTAF